MRTRPDQKRLQEWLIEIGEGRYQGNPQRGPNGYMLPIPNELVSNDLQSIINFCFPPALFRDPFNNADAIAHNALLCPKNKEVDDINAGAMLRMDGEGIEHRSIDEALGTGDPLDTYRADSTMEAVNNECPSGFPPHKLFLKVTLNN